MFRIRVLRSNGADKGSIIFWPLRSATRLPSISIPLGPSVGAFDGGSGLIPIYHGREDRTADDRCGMRRQGQLQPQVSPMPREGIHCFRFGIIRSAHSSLRRHPARWVQVSRTASAGFLSSHMAMKVQCLRCPRPAAALSASLCQ
jgi:hypothetical protein